MLKYLIPNIALSDLLPMFITGIIGAIIAGAYGIVHDHLTYSIGPEYFTQFKFYQFRYADLGFGDRVFVSCIGFLASWWVGLIIGWLLARRFIPNQPRVIAYQKIADSFGIVFLCGFASGLIGYVYGLWCGPAGDYSAWEEPLGQIGVSDVWRFVRVGYIHNASYLGGVIGLVLALVLVRREATP